MTPTIPVCSGTFPDSSPLFCAGFLGTQISERSHAPRTHLGTQPACGSGTKGSLTEYCKQTGNVELQGKKKKKDPTQRLCGSASTVESREVTFPTQTAGWRVISHVKSKASQKRTQANSGHNRQRLLGSSKRATKEEICNLCQKTVGVL